ncbi:hypothetical protein NHX12_009439 [Muraenolepis orangiensis]|uniref:Uncharacterized protein n=1 Tax=Muraenolepis orangiensis TaxID=630683 RepID=A0A9Q0DMN4_9TELE|nr:hypothetical protein NHX12_009439 [Muraenolepis orangiensis]
MELDPSPVFSNTFGKNSSWLVFLEEETNVKVVQLLQVLSKFDRRKEWFLWKPLHDEESTIIHHYTFAENPASVQIPRLQCGLGSEHLTGSEVGLYIWDVGEGPRLTGSPTLPLLLRHLPQLPASGLFPVVKQTWEMAASLGVPNNERGHCGKIFAILNRFVSSDVPKTTFPPPLLL